MFYIVATILGYGVRMVNLLNNQILEASTPEVIEKVKRKEIAVENAKIENGVLVATRGAWNRYGLAGVAPQKPVILYRLEDDNRTVKGYRVYTAEGQIADLSVEDTLSMGLAYGFANAKISTNTKKTYITALGGSFPLRVIRTMQVDVSKIVIEISKKGEQAVGVVTVTEKTGKFARSRIAVSTSLLEKNLDGLILGKVFNRFLKYKVYEVIDGKRQPTAKKPKGVLIEKTVNFVEGLPVEDYMGMGSFLNCSIEKVLEKVNYTMYQIKSE